VSTILILPPPLRGRAGDGRSRESRRLQWVRTSLQRTLSALLFLACVSTHVKGDEARWRLFEEQDTALLAIADTAEGTDALGSPLFRCKKRSGYIEAEGSANADIRVTMAAMISSDKYPLIQLLPEAKDNVTLLSLSYSEADEGWRFNFLLEAVGPTFEEFKCTGQLAFKAGAKVIRTEFKVGIENAARFQDICKRTPK
jgi:hypothetical protein